jgi:putative flippase GtrA
MAPRLVSELLVRNQQFILYCLLGLIGVVVDLTTYWVLVNALFVHHQWANVMSTLCGIFTSFFLNATYTFQIKDFLLLRLFFFFLIGILGLLISAMKLYDCVDQLHFDKNWVKIACIYVVLVQYNLNRLVSFRR